MTRSTLLTATKQSPPCVSRPCQWPQCDLTTCEDGPNLRRGSSTAKVISDAFLRTTVVLPDGFDADCSDQDMVRHFDIVRGREKDFKGPPLKPSRFNEKLRQLHEVTQGNGVRLFINGLEDMHLVRRKFADSYALLTKSTDLYYKAIHWSSDDFECLVEAMPDFTDLRIFAFMKFKLSTDQGQRLAMALSHCRACSQISMGFNRFSLCGQYALFVQWRAKQSVWCCADCCLCGELCCCCGGLCCGCPSDGIPNCFCSWCQFSFL